MARAVKTVKEFEDQQRGLNDEAKALGIKGGQAGSQLLKNVVGDHTEWGLCDELKTYYDKHLDKKKFVLLGPCFKTPESDKNESGRT